MDSQQISQTHWTNYDLLLVLLRNRSANSIIDAEAVDILPEAQAILRRIPRLPEEDVELFRLVSHGKLPVIKESEKFRTPGYFHAKLNEKGYTIWHLAIHRRDLSLLQLLLPDVDKDILYDLLLHAVQTQEISIVRIMWNCIQQFHPDIKCPDDLSRWSHSRFSYDITPIILSAQIGNFKLIKFFYGLGETFAPLHIDLPTRATITKAMANDMKIGYAKLHEFQVLASPEMICYQTLTDPGYDPILSIIVLHSDLDLVRFHEHELEHHYAALQVNLETFLRTLIDLCRSDEEMRLILIQKEGYVGVNHVYPRLMLAIRMNRYEFVTHPHCQRMVYMLWAGKQWPEWKFHSGLWKFGYIILRTIFLPFVSIWLYFDSCSSKSAFLQAPVNRFINEVGSDVYFLLLLAFEATSLTGKSDANIHNTPNKTTEVLIMIFFFGHFVETIKHFLDSPKTFFINRWNCFETLICFVYLVTFTCWGITWYTEWVEPTPTQVERLWWNFYDPVVLGETFFAAGLVIWYGSFLRFLQIHSTLGPLQLKLTSILGEIFVFLFFFIAAIFAFAHSLYFIYNPLIPVGETKSSHYSNYLETFYTVLSGLLRKVDPEIFEQGGHHIGEAVGKFLWMVYYLIGTSILVLMFLAYAVFRFRDDNDDIIWKWNRTKVWIYYTTQVPAPSPINLIPTISGTIKFAKKLINRGKRGKLCTMLPFCRNSSEESAERKSIRQNRYRRFTTELVQRYLRSKLIANPPAPTAASGIPPGTANQIKNLKAALDGALRLNSKRASATSSFQRNDKESITINNGRKHRSSSNFNLAWTLKAKPVPSPIRQDFTPQKLSSSNLK